MAGESLLNVSMAGILFDDSVSEPSTLQAHDGMIMTDKTMPHLEDLEPLHMENDLMMVNLTGRLFEWQVKERFDSNRSGDDQHIGISFAPAPARTAAHARPPFHRESRQR